MVHWLLLTVSFWAIGVGLAHADATTDALDQVSRCAAIADAAERLKCFDRAAPAAKEAQVPKPADFGKPVARVPEPAQIAATVRELSRTVRGRVLFVLDNGQVWRQLDADDTAVLEPPPGQALKVTIQHGLLDSYNLVIEGRNSLIKVRRVE
jgi:hypothetical protein